MVDVVGTILGLFWTILGPFWEHFGILKAGFDGGLRTFGKELKAMLRGSYFGGMQPLVQLRP